MAVAKFLPPPSILRCFVDHLGIDCFTVFSTLILDQFVMAYATPIGPRRDSFHLHLLQSIECNEYIQRQDFVLAYTKLTTFSV